MKTNKYIEEIKELDIKAYAGTPAEDNMILDWWSQLVTTTELDEIFSKSCYSLSKFYKLFQRPNWLFYKANKEGLQLAVWAEPAFSTAFVGMWVAPTSRHSKSVFRSIQLIYYTLFTFFHCLMGVTKQEKLLTTHVKLGYNVVGKVDGLLDDQPAWIVHLSKKSFENSRLNPKKR
jgi:hypothetical protein